MTIGSGQRGAHRRRFKAVLCDLDDTLYRQHEVPMVVRKRIEEFITQKLGVPQDQVAAYQAGLYRDHGTTLAGLVASGHKINYDEWHKFVHYGAGAIDYDKLLQPDPELHELLCSIDLPKYILTNADKVHTQKCLERLGLIDCFQGQFYFENVMQMAATAGINSAAHPAVLCKPQPACYKLIAQQLGYEASDLIFVDDSPRNVASAHALGIFTILVGQEGPVPGADIVVQDMHELPRVLPELFDQPGEVKSLHLHAEPMAQPVAIPALAS